MTNHVLKHEGKLLQAILSKVDNLQRLNLEFSQHLDADLAKHCQVAKIENDRLIVIVDNSNWATQLRFYIPDLIPKLRSYPPLKNLQAICSKVRPDYKPVKSLKHSRKVMSLSFETAEIVLKTAKNIKDEKLRKILEKIAGHLSLF